MNEAALYGSSLEERLGALRELCAQAGARERRGTNCHIHTSESFSVFRSPSEAVWQGVREGIALLGINDHYTVAGHDEFRQACAIAGIEAAFSMEAVGMDRAAEAAGLLLNDPDNPGRVYLCGKGITRIPPAASAAAKNLATMCAALARRNREMTALVTRLFRERLDGDGPSWEDVLALTPRGNATERHLSRAALIRLRALAAQRGEDLAQVIQRACGATPPAAADDAALQNFLRAKLLKAGMPCYVPETEDAFISSADLRAMFLAFGAIPTYPILGNPVTGGERDIDALLDRLESSGFYAVEVIPHRNTRERLSEIVAAARRRWWPVFNGTEHNTAESRPMLDPYALDPEFEPWFRQSAALLIAHQQRAGRGEAGFVDENGCPSIPDARTRFESFSSTAN
jgi:hypothetical protein